VSYFASGQVASLHTAAVDVHTGPHGERTVVWRRPDQSVLVRTGRHLGYLEKPVTLPDNRRVIQRTYVTNGVVFTRTFEPYSYHGAVLLNYVPEGYFAPGMYGWVYYPWKPVAIAFIPGNAPWYAANRDYFAPSPLYQSGYSWLADFDLSDVLSKCFDQQSAEDSSVEARSAQPLLENHISAEVNTPITPTIKDAIAGEIRDQLARSNLAASGSANSIHTELAESLQLDHVFVVSSSLEVNARDDQTCSLSGGDVLQLASTPEGDGTIAQARVASSHRADCPAGEIVAVSLQDLQEMQNDLRAEMDAGLRKLRDNQGRDGWPTAPPSAVSPQPRPAMDGLPPADPQAGELIEAQQHEVAEAEASVVANAFAAN